MTVLILSSRGSTATTKYLIKDISNFIKCERESKYDIKQNIKSLNNLIDLHKCSSIIYFETTKRNEKLWIGLRNGYSIRFNVYNVFTIKMLKAAVNCFKDCGHVLVFTPEFDEIDYLIKVKQVFKEVFISAEVKDRALSFFWADDKIWVRNYVIEESDLNEIGPRFVIEVDKILEKCFSGPVVYSRKVDLERKEVSMTVE